MKDGQKDEGIQTQEGSEIGSVASHWEFDDAGKLRRVVVEFIGDAEGTVVVLPPIK